MDYREWVGCPELDGGLGGVGAICEEEWVDPEILSSNPAR
jgi:hypothetical protein